MNSTKINSNVSLLCLSEDISIATKILEDKLRNKVQIFSPICPDYSFEEKITDDEKKERIHDFTSMGTKKGIVYEKLIQTIEPVLKQYEKNNIDYDHILLVADVEVVDEEILRKLDITEKEFLSNCNSTVEDINRDLKDRGLTNSRAINMSTFFEEDKFDFHKQVELNYEELLKKSDSEISDYLMKTIDVRIPLYSFWFNMNESLGKERAIHEVGMYAAFGMSPSIKKGLIMCADSEILSYSYNIFNDKKNIVPTLYITGNY